MARPPSGVATVGHMHPGGAPPWAGHAGAMEEPDMSETTVYTDGACLGNPGPGGWAWAVPGRPLAQRRRPPLPPTSAWRSAAALDAARTLEGPLEVVSDSTYVVNCFRDGWWEGWLARGWVGAAEAEGGQPGPVGAPGRPVPELTGAHALPLGEGPRQRPFQRPGGPPGGGRGDDPARGRGPGATDRRRSWGRPTCPGRAGRGAAGERRRRRRPPRLAAAQEAGTACGVAERAVVLGQGGGVGHVLLRTPPSTTRTSTRSGSGRRPRRRALLGPAGHVGDSSPGPGADDEALAQEAVEATVGPTRPTTSSSLPKPAPARRGDENEDGRARGPGRRPTTARWRAAVPLNTRRRARAQDRPRRLHTRSRSCTCLHLGPGRPGAGPVPQGGRFLLHHPGHRAPGARGHGAFAGEAGVDEGWQSA